jgi:hypothetical protein
MHGSSLGSRGILIRPKRFSALRTAESCA